MNRSTVHVWAATVLVIFAVLTVWLASFDTRTQAPQPNNGDVVGMENSESLEEYVKRAHASLDGIDDAPRFALVTFTAPTPPRDVALALADVHRVSAMIVGLGAPIALPEPLAGEDRSAPIHRSLERVGQSLSHGQFPVPAPETITAVLVWDTGTNLQALASQPGVLAVEALPPDAAWGQFGVRPVVIPGAAESVPGV